MSVRFAVSKYLNGSMLFKKTIVNPKGFLSWGNGPRKKFMIGIGISRYNLSGLLNQEKAFVGIAGLKNLFEDPPYEFSYASYRTKSVLRYSSSNNYWSHPNWGQWSKNRTYLKIRGSQTGDQGSSSFSVILLFSWSLRLPTCSIRL